MLGREIRWLDRYFVWVDPLGLVWVDPLESEASETMEPDSSGDLELESGQIGQPHDFHGQDADPPPVPGV
jgi:hypothetical protein